MPVNVAERCALSPKSAFKTYPPCPPDNLHFLVTPGPDRAGEEDRQGIAARRRAGGDPGQAS